MSYRGRGGRGGGIPGGHNSHRAGGSSTSFRGKCHNCDQIGHQAINCPNQSTSSSSSSAATPTSASSISNYSRARGGYRGGRGRGGYQSHSSGQNHHANPSNGRELKTPNDMLHYLESLTKKGENLNQPEEIAAFASIVRHKGLQDIQKILKFLLASPRILAEDINVTHALLKLLGLGLWSDPANANHIGEKTNGLFIEIGEELSQLLARLVMSGERLVQAPVALIRLVQHLMILLLERLPTKFGFVLCPLLPSMQFVLKMMTGRHGSEVMKALQDKATEFERLSQQYSANLETRLASSPAVGSAAALSTREERLAAEMKVEQDAEDATAARELDRSYMELNVIPSLPELLNPPAHLPSGNRVNRPYLNGHQLLNTQVRLMKEDVVRPLREGVSAYLRGDLKEARDSLAIYHHVAFFSVVCDKNHGLLYRITFRTPHKDMDWSRSSKLMYGSLVLLTKDRLTSEPLWAEVFKRDEQYMNYRPRPSIDIRILQGHAPISEVGELPPAWTMIEATQSYFLPYRHVITAMQRLGEEPLLPAARLNQPENANLTQLPFSHHFARLERQVATPAYFQRPNMPHYNMKSIYNNVQNYLNGKETFDITQEWPKQLIEEDLSARLDQHQMLALKHILTKQLAIVQGPPGTGKTYVALKALRVLLDRHNRDLRGDTGPILVVALTNHALDQLLEGVLKFEENIIRVGSRSESESLQNKTLFEARERARRRPYDQGPFIHGMGELMGKRERLVGMIGHNIGMMARGLTLATIKELQIATPEQISELEGQHQSLRNDLESEDESDDEQIAEANQPKKGGQMYGKNQSSRQYQEPAVPTPDYSSSSSSSSKFGRTGDDDDGQWTKVRSKKMVKHHYDIVDFWLHESDIRQKRHQKKLRMEAQARELAAKAQTKSLASIPTSINPYDEEAMLAQSLLQLQVSNQTHQSHNSTSHSSASAIPADVPDPTDDVDMDDEDEDEIKAAIAEREVDVQPKIEYVMKEIKSFARCPARYVEPTPAVLEAKLFSLAPHQRECLHWYWMRQWRKKLFERLEPAIESFEQVNREIKEQYRIADVRLLKSCKVVGMTTTGASSLQEVVQQLRPKIIMMEEAAEVLESHILASLSETVQHLILIGDHKQLQPDTSHYDLTRIYKLNVSLFERMIINGIESHQLRTQRRMRPIIRELSSFHYGNIIEDGSNVLAYPDQLQGLATPLFFLRHHQREGSIGQLDEPGKFNSYEATMIVRLAIYLCNSGHSPKDITILTTYKEQYRLIKKLLAQSVGPKTQIVCRVVDKYQGEECKIILLSLVRSYGAPIDSAVAASSASFPASTSTPPRTEPHKQPLGFLNKDNRMCVALSRAKEGMIVIGNFDMLKKYNASWREICKRIENRQLMGDSLPLYCPRHAKPTSVTIPSDFNQVPEGGCTALCRTQMPCGHVCKKVCHGYDTEHEKLPCTDFCSNAYPGCQHRCGLPCHKGAMFTDAEKECPPCPTLVPKIIPSCKHEQLVPCHQDPNTFPCRINITHTFKCGHTEPRKCHERYQPSLCQTHISVKRECGHTQSHVKCGEMEKLHPCSKKCDKPLDCGDGCPGICHECATRGSHLSCTRTCQRQLLCGHPCQVAHGCKEKCPPCIGTCLNSCVHGRHVHPCSQPCLPCKEPCAWKCDHYQCTRLCGEPCNRPPCTKPCSKRLSCGHRCIGVCGEPCINACRAKYCPQSERDVDVMDDTFSSTKLKDCEPGQQFVQLECGHIFEVNGLDQYMHQRLASSSSSSTLSSESVAISLPRCPLCKRVMYSCLRYGTVINKVVDDLERIKFMEQGKIEEMLQRLYRESAHMKEKEREKWIQEQKKALMAVEGNSSHWFTCSKGHLYVIGDCGGANQISNCPECKETIGGSSHRLVDTSRPAFSHGSQGSSWMPNLRPDSSLMPVELPPSLPTTTEPTRRTMQPRSAFPFQIVQPDQSTTLASTTTSFISTNSTHSIPVGSTAALIAEQDEEYLGALRIDEANRSASHL